MRRRADSSASGVEIAAGLPRRGNWGGWLIGWIVSRAAGPLSGQSDFLRLWAAQSVSSIGALIAREGLPLAAVLTLHSGPLAIGLLAALRAAAALLVGLFTGGLVDRRRRKRILIMADLGRAAILVAIPAAAFAHRLAIAEIYLAAALVGALNVLFDMADHAYLPSLIPPRLLLAANARLAMTESVAEIGGPSLAGVLFALLTAPIAIVVNALTYLASAAILATIRSQEPPPASTGPSAPGLSPTVWLDMATGFRLTFASPVVRALFLSAATSALFGGFFSALYIVFAVTRLGLSPALLGATIAVGGVGSVVGAALAGRLARRLGIGPAIAAAGLAAAAFTVFIPLAGGGRWRAAGMLMVAQLFGDALATAALIYAKSVRQSVLPPEVMGRVGGAFAAGPGALAVAGALIGGWLGQTFGVRPPLYIACAGLGLAPLWCLASPLSRLRRLPG